ncbi:MAG: GGDEF domain-containing protein [Acidobacteriota bacterium]
MQDLLRQSPLLAGVPPTTVSAIVAGSELRHLAAQDILLSAGTANRTLYLVVSGRLRVHVPGTDEPHVQIEAGECVGELSIIDGREVSADVVADEPTSVLALDHEQLWWLIDYSAEAARNLLRILAGRVRHDDAMLGESRRRRTHLEDLATVDALTGLRNRRWLDEMFARQIDRASRSGQPVSLLMIDVDHFKRRNDVHGHLVGDAVLRRVALTLASHLRPQDMLARFGGEEFAVLLPDCPAHTAETSAERLRHAVEAAPPDAVDLPAAPAATISVGIACGLPGDTLAALLDRADRALYRAKDSGRNRWST